MKKHLRSWGCLTILVLGISIFVSFFGRSLRNGESFQHPGATLVQAVISAAVILVSLVILSKFRKR